MISHVSRQPISATYRDRDIISFIPDRLSADVSTAMVIKNTSSSDSILEMTDLPTKNQRILMYSRQKTDGAMTNGLRVCAYKESSVNEETGETTTVLKPLREIINPIVVYDKDSNVITMNFWTNFIVDPGDDPTDYNDENTSLYYINEDAFDSNKKVIRAYCNCVGAFYEFYITGGSVDTANNGYDVIPIFNKPTILKKRVVPIATGDTMGIPIIDFVSAGSSIVVEDEGAVQTCAAGILNFIGAGVTAAYAGSSKVNVTIPGITANSVSAAIPAGKQVRTITVAITAAGVLSLTLSTDDCI